MYSLDLISQILLHSRLPFSFSLLLPTPGCPRSSGLQTVLVSRVWSKPDRRWSRQTTLSCNTWILARSWVPTTAAYLAWCWPAFCPSPLSGSKRPCSNKQDNGLENTLSVLNQTKRMGRAFTHQTPHCSPIETRLLWPALGPNHQTKGQGIYPPTH